MCVLSRNEMHTHVNMSRNEMHTHVNMSRNEMHTHINMSATNIAMFVAGCVALCTAVNVVVRETVHVAFRFVTYLHVCAFRFVTIHTFGVCVATSF